MESLKGKKVLVIGGSSGIGYAIASLAMQEEANVIIAGRSTVKLDKAKNRLSNKVITKQVDICNQSLLSDFFSEIGQIDHLQITASDLKTGLISTFPLEAATASFNSKFWGPYMVVQSALPYLNENASITLYSGAYSQRPIIMGSTVAAAINSAIEGLGRALAVELNPIRVNVISPGLILTERYTDNYSAEQVKEIVSNFCQNVIMKRPGNPEEVASTAIHLMKNTYLTGVTIFVDGGLTLR